MDKPMSLAELKSMYKNQRVNKGLGTETEVLVPGQGKKEYKSIFEQQLNYNFSKDAEQDGGDDVIMVRERPKDLD
jgi:hypothetical protein